MSRARKTRLVRDMEKCLRESGLPWSLEAGKKHWRVILSGECIGVLSYGSGYNGTDGHNLMSIIKRKAKGC